MIYSQNPPVFSEIFYHFWTKDFWPLQKNSIPVIGSIGSSSNFAGSLVVTQGPYKNWRKKEEKIITLLQRITGVTDWINLQLGFLGKPCYAEVPDAQK